MGPDLRGRLAKAARLEIFATLPAKAWRTLSLVLTGGGVVLLSLGGWMFYEQYRDLIGPPPARIVEVSVDDLVTATPLTEPTQTPLTQETTEVTFVSVTPTLPPTSTPIPTSRARATHQAGLTGTKPSPPATRKLSATATPTPERSSTPASATPTNSSTLSLAENPLLVVEEETTTPEPGKERQPTKAAPQQQAGVITRVVAETIELDSPVVDVGWQNVIQNGISMNVWTVADYAAGWHKNSMLPGQGGNVVLSGHHNINGEVFRYIVDLEPGAEITLYEGDQPHLYVVEDKFIVKDKGEPEAIRRENAKWIGPFNEERLTLVTCWPYTNNTHRVIVIAKPAPQD